MKKLILFSVIVVILAAVPLRAADISVGATTWYSTWKYDDGVQATRYDPAWFYGPALSVKFNNDFTLSSVFLYASYDVDLGSIKFDWNRYDSDTSLNVRLNDYFKLFGGVKYLGYKMEIPLNTGHFYAVGPAAGLSMVFPLINNFFILGNASGMYLRGKTTQTGTEDTKYKTTGYNTAASVAYYIEPASVTLSLGGRYQYYKLESISSTDDMNKNKFYGITGSATYSFGI